MAFELKMPKLGESVTEGTIGKWLKQPGDKVNKYDLLVEVQTDKVNTEIPSPVAGTLKEVKVEEGQTVPIGTLLAIFDTADGEAAAQPSAAAASAPAQPSSSPQPQASSQPTAAAGFPAVFGYNAIRIPLYMIWAGIVGENVIGTLVGASGVDGSRPLSVVGVASGRPVEALSSPGYSAISALHDCAVNGKRWPAALNDIAPSEHYYPATLQLLALSASISRWNSCGRG